MKKLTALLFILLAASAVAIAASPDRGFYMKAAAVGMAEVETGKLAQQKGSTEAVRSFGAKMVQDHTAANEKLMALAASKQVKLPKGMDFKHKIMHKSLGTKSGADFDKAYIKGQIADHKATIELFEREIASGKDADAKAFAAASLPVVKSHMAMLQTMTGASAGGANMGGHTGSQTQMAPGSGVSQMNSNTPGGAGISGTAGAASRPGSSSGSGTGTSGSSTGTSGTGMGTSGTGATGTTGNSGTGTSSGASSGGGAR